MPIKIAVGQSGGPTPVMNDALAGIISESQSSGLEVVGLMNGLQGGGLYPDIDGNLEDLTSLDPNSIRGPPGAYLGTTRLKLKPGEDDDLIARVQDNMRGLGVDMVFYIGGNDSADTLSTMKSGIHIQKTVDNDLLGNDHTSGFGSACLANSEMIRRLACDMGGFNARVRHNGHTAYSTAPVVVYQTQGRDTGWLAYGTSFAKVDPAGDYNEDAPPHVFLTREVPFDQGTLLDRVDNILSKKGFVFIACGEELVDNSGKTLAEVYGIEESTDEHGNIQHGRPDSFSYGLAVAQIITQNLGKKGKAPYLEIKDTVIEPQHIQRSLFRSEVDGDEAFETGRVAVRAYLAGERKASVALHRHDGDYNITPEIIPLETVAAKTRKVDPIYSNGIEGPKQKFIDDFLPLLGGPSALTHYGSK